MKVGRDSNISRISELRNDINKLQKELDDLYNEHTRLKDVIRQEIHSGTTAEPFQHSPGIYRQIVESAQEGIWISDLEVKTVFVNRRMADMLGYSVDEMMGRSAYDFLDDEGKAIARNNKDKRIAGDKETYEQKYIRRDGTVLWAMLSASPLYNDQGKIHGILGMLTDITPRKIAEENLSKSEKRFRLLADNISQITWITNQEGEIEWYNKQWYNFTGKSIENMREDGYPSVIHPDYADNVLESFRHSRVTGNPWECYVPLRGRNGEYRWFLTRALPVSDDNGRIIYWFGTNTDVTEQRQTEEILRENELRLTGIFNNAAVGIVELDYHNQFITVNDRICEILGYSANELTGKKMEEIIPDEDHDTGSSHYNRLKTGEKEIVNFEKRFFKKDGSTLWVQVSLTAIRNTEGEFIRSIGTVEDISHRKQTELSLKEALKKAEESQNILTALMENIPLGITIAQAPDAQIRMVSKHGLDLINQKSKDIIGTTAASHQKLWGVYHLDGTPAEAGDLPLTRTVTNGEQVRNEEWYFTRQNGNCIPVLCNAAPVRDKKNTITGGVMAWQDISESKSVMEELKKREEQYRNVIEAADLGTWDFDIETGIANHSLRHDQIFGYQEFQSEWSYEISVKHILPEFHEVVRNAVARAIETGILEYDAKIRLPDGSIRWIGPRGRVKYSAEGKPLRMSGIVADITRSKMAEEALRESEEKFRSLFENITEGVALHEIIYEDNKPVNYCIIETNPAFRNYTAFTIRSDAEKPALELFQQNKFPYLETFARVAETRVPIKFEANLNGPDKHFIINVISPRKGQFATVLEDISEQKRIEQELKLKNEELTRFIYTVSHDLKSPLVTIKSFTSFLKEDIASNDTEAQNRDIGFIQNAIDRMNNQLDELLELSRIGRKEIPKTYISLREVVETAMRLVAGRLLPNRIRVEITGMPVMLYGHTQRLIQLYQNLLDNAAKFMGNQSEPVIEAGAEFHPDKNKTVMFVRDNGIGIDPQYHHKLFGLFEKLDTHTEGTGIGLALIKRIIEVHGGTIWFKSDGLNQGTTFYFTLEKTKISES